MNSTTHRTRQRTDGFSLIETLIVIAIIGIMATMAIPQIASYIRVYKIKAAQQQITSEIQTARNKAISRNVRFGVVFVPLSNTTYRYVYEDDVTPPYDGAPTAPALSTAMADPARLGPLRALPEGVQFGTAAPCRAADNSAFVANGTGFRFKGMGTWCSPGSATNCGALDAGTTVLDNRVALGTSICLIQPLTGLVRHVLISPGGRVRADQ
jgi:prepilin-type N-terminal cleavage/methylation domain-containing protein